MADAFETLQRALRIPRDKLERIRASSALTLSKIEDAPWLYAEQIAEHRRILASVEAELATRPVRQRKQGD